MNPKAIWRVALAALVLWPILGSGLAGRRPVQAQEDVATVRLNGPPQAAEVENEYPSVQLRLSVLDANGMALPDLGPSDFQVTERGRRIPAEELSAQLEDTGMALAVVIDVSGSMDDQGTPGNSRFQDAQALVERFIETLNPEDWVAIYTFGQGVWNPLPLTYDHGRALTVVRREIEVPPPGDERRMESWLFRAMRQAILDLVGTQPQIPNFAHMRKALLVISDGKSEGDFGIDDVKSALAQDSYRLISIHAVGVGSEVAGQYQEFPADHSDVEYLSTIAEGSFVRYFGANAESVAQADAQFSASVGHLPSLGKQYLLTWTSMSPDGPAPVIIAVQDQTVNAEVVIPVVPPVFQGYSIVSESDRVRIQTDFKVQQRPIVAVDFRNDGQLVGTTGPPFEFVWDTSRIEPGTYQLEMQARDERGIRSTAVLLQAVTVAPSPTPTPTPTPTAEPTTTPLPTPTVAALIVPTANPAPTSWFQDPNNIPLMVMTAILLLLVILLVWMFVWFVRRLESLALPSAPGRRQRVLEATVSLLRGREGARLQVTAGKDQGDIIPLDASGRIWRFGRDPDYNDRILNDPTVSRITNFTIAHEGRRYFLTAQPNTTPVFHNGNECQVEKRVELRDGDRVSVGLVEILFLLDRDGDESSPPGRLDEEDTTRVSPDQALQASRE